MHPRTLSCCLGVITMLLAGTSAHAGAERPIVAVFDVEYSRVKLGRAAQRTLDGYLRDRLAAAGNVQLVPRAEIRKRLRGEKKASYRDCYDQSCQIEIGRELAASKTLSTKVSRVGKECVVSATIYDLKKATSETGAVVRGGCDEKGIMTSMDRVVDQLSGGKAAAPSAGDMDRAIAASVKAMPSALAAKARGLWASCKKGEMTECKELGKMYLVGDEAIRDAHKAFALFTRACEGGLSAGCFNLGVMYYKGLGVPMILTEALGLYRKACDAGLAQGCHFLGEMYLSGKGLPRRDRARGLELCWKGCKGGYLEGCNSLGLKYEEGLHMPRDYRRAFELYRKACDGGTLRGCLNVGLSYMRGRGVPRSREKAIPLLRKGCEGGIKLACKKLAELGQQK